MPFHIENQDTYSIVKRLIPEGKTTCSLCSRLRRGILYRDIVIRPMAYVKEADSTRYAEVKQFPIIPCDLCGSQENLQRKQIKGLMRKWEKEFPGRVESIFSSLSTVVPSHLMDPNMFGFKDLMADGVASPLGDIAFDEEPCSTPTMGTIPLQSLQ